MLKKRKAYVVLPVLAVMLGGLVGCAATTMTYKPVTLQKAAVKEQAAEEKKEGSVKAPDYEKLERPGQDKPAIPPPPLPPRTPIDPKLLQMHQGAVTINVESMPLGDFIVYALGETLKVSFIMDEAVMKNKKPVSLRMPQAMPSDKALELLIGLLQKNNLYLEQRSGALYIFNEPPTQQREKLDIRVGREIADSSASVLQVVPLRHVGPNIILPLIKDLLKSPVQIQTPPRGNLLLIYGQAFQVRQILSLVETFDVPTLQNRDLSLIRLTYWQAEEFIKELTKILKGIGFEVANTANDPGPLFIPIKQLNGILVASPDERTTRYILEWKGKLDRPEAAGDAETAFTYYPKYARATELVDSIKKLYSGVSSGSESTAKQQKTGQTQSGTAGSSGTGIAPVISSGVGAGSASGSGAQILGMPGLKISGDDSKNIVIIIGSASAYKNIVSILKSLDLPARQVVIEATVAQLTLTDELKYGVEWMIKNAMSDGSYTLGTLGNLGVSDIAGLSYSFVSGSGKLQALVNALASANKANILSTPRLTVIDNKEATIQVGQDVPVVTAEVTAADTATSTSSSVTRSVQYRSTGVMLTVKPTINTEGLVTLTISQEVSNPGADGAGGSPIIQTRKINTTVVVGHGQTLALGGLMQETDSLSEAKVPLLGDLPLIGNVFKYTSKTKEKTELLVLVTPTILTNTDEAAQITDELRKELKWLK